MTLIDVLALLFISILTVVFGAWAVYVDRVLSNPEHPDHEVAKEAVAEQHRQNEMDRLRDAFR